MAHLSICSTFIPSILTIMALMALNGCKNHDKETVTPPAKVEVKVMGDNTQGGDGRLFSGTTESAESSTVSFSVPGTATRSYVNVGDKVSKGQLLARIKDQSLVNTNNIAQAELEEARDAYRRLKKLHDANALPDIKWVEVQSKLKQAENAAALAGRAVGDASLYSPITGYVSEKMMDDGQTVIAAQPVMRIVNLNDMRIAISVPEQEISNFNDGCAASITVGGVDSMRLQGRLVQKAVVADPLTRSYTVKFSIPNPDDKILPGMIGTVAVNGCSADSIHFQTSSFVLPSQSVLLDSDSRQFVWVVKNGKAMRRFITSDQFTHDGVMVNGLSRGDSVIVAGMQKVSTGTEVSVVK